MSNQGIRNDVLNEDDHVYVFCCDRCKATVRTNDQNQTNCSSCEDEIDAMADIVWGDFA